MTYSSNTLNASPPGKSALRTGIARLGHEVSLLAGALALVLWLLTLLSYSPLDMAWSTSGAGDGLVRNRLGRAGAWLADVSYFSLGFSVWWCLVAGAFVWLSSLARRLRGDELLADELSLKEVLARRARFWGGLALLLCASAGLEWSRLYHFESLLPGHAGGVLGYIVGPATMRWLGFDGSGLLGFALAVLGAAQVFHFSWTRLAEGLGARLDAVVQLGRVRREEAKDIAEGKRAARLREEVVHEERIELEEHHPQPLKIIDPEQAAPRWVDPAPDSAPAPLMRERSEAPAMDRPRTGLPPLTLLETAVVRQEAVSSDTLEMTSRLIEKKLRDFGVEVTVAAAMPGPVVTRYEIKLAPDVLPIQIVELARDLARALSLVSIRVVETIVGKDHMALELPNVKRQSIRLTEILASAAFREHTSLLALALGKDIVGHPVVADLAKMPHVLLAGTADSGKAMGLHAMLLSVLYKAEPADVRLLLIDPKMLEMSLYAHIPHLLAPVVTDMRQAARGLNWCVTEMERRYRLMGKLGVRNLAAYNAKIDAAEARDECILNPLVADFSEPEPLGHLPHIVVVVDELADLMLVAGKKTEELIARLAQKARATGIHLILSTHRPGTEVITALIKANIPTRMAFQVSSKTDSRAILDQTGAETLLGMGDMLYVMAGAGVPTRVHGALVSADEVHRVVAFLKSQGRPVYVPGVLDEPLAPDETVGF
ncbi:MULTISPECIES: DNA translocase FtsK [Giesbergeria]|uniref:DNA translocase FtsK n=1 Tax=Giesbergeria sinuosa TaxID=80883 RepID=A0ABV9QFJ0_9BURK